MQAAGKEFSFCSEFPLDFCSDWLGICEDWCEISVMSAACGFPCGLFVHGEVCKSCS